MNPEPILCSEHYEVRGDALGVKLARPGEDCDYCAPPRKTPKTKSRYRVRARLDGARGEQDGTVTIDRRVDVFTVRPLRRRRSFSLPLSFVAQLVTNHVLRVEAQQKRAAKKAARRRR